MFIIGMPPHPTRTSHATNSHQSRWNDATSLQSIRSDRTTERARIEREVTHFSNLLTSPQCTEVETRAYRNRDLRLTVTPKTIRAVRTAIVMTSTVRSTHHLMLNEFADGLRLISTEHPAASVMSTLNPVHAVLYLGPLHRQSFLERVKSSGHSVHSVLQITMYNLTLSAKIATNRPYMCFGKVPTLALSPAKLLPSLSRSSSPPILNLAASTPRGCWPHAVAVARLDYRLLDALIA